MTTYSDQQRSRPRADTPISLDEPIQVVNWSNRGPWDAFAEAAIDGRIEHLWTWGDVAERAYGHHAVRLAAVRGDRLVGMLPLVLMRSHLFGRALVSMPFADYGGLCTGEENAADLALVSAAVAMAQRERAVLDLRHASNRAIGLPVSHEKATVVLDLGEDEEELWKSLPAERRRQVRKGISQGLTTSVHGPEALPDFYRVQAENMRNHGSPVHSRRFFKELMAGLGERARILTVELEGTVLGAAVLLFFRDTLTVGWAAAFRAARSMSANQVLYWDAMRLAISSGYRVLDFGRSTPGTGPFEFKREWGARPVPLPWNYFPETAGPPGTELQRFSWGVRMWRKLPVGVANLIGSRLRGGISN
jgi:FemAB-related protein (PEP-CTERM system-associated)